VARIELCNLVKSFGAVQAVKDLSFTIEDGEFVVFVGPSGCGKSTLANALAGTQVAAVSPRISAVGLGLITCRSRTCP